MTNAEELERALTALFASGPVELDENGRWLAALAGLQYEVRRRGSSTLLHLWSEQQNLVRRVLRITEQSPEQLVIEVQRFGRSKPDTLAFHRAQRAAGRLTREQFRERFRQLLAEQFPDEKLDSLTTAADMKHSLSGCYARGLLHQGSRAWAVTGVSSAEAAATIDALLAFGLLWLDRARQQAQRRAVAGLRIFLPEGMSRVTAHRLSGIEPSTHIELYEVNESSWRARQLDPRDVGNLATWLTPRRELDFLLAAASSALERIRQLAPDAIGLGAAPGTTDVALRFRGLEIARWHSGAVSYGLGDHREELNERTWPKLERLVHELETFRHPLASDTSHPLYRNQAERWLETMVYADAARIDPRLDPQRIYSQVPAFAAGDRGVIDLLGVTQDGRLAVIELKAGEDIQLPLQAVDYWLRVRWHHQQGDFHRYGYFAGVQLQPKPPLLYLVAPSLRFHPSTDTLLRYLTPETEVQRVGLNENWRRGLRVVFRQLAPGRGRGLAATSH